MFPRLYILPLILGFVATSIQTILLRHFFILFSGIELITGVFFTFWLFWTAAGGILATLLIKKIKKIKKLQDFLSFLGIFTFITLPLYLLSIFWRTKLSLNLGEIVAVNKIIAFSSVILTLPCIILGFYFGISCFILLKEKTIEKIGYSYIFESLGSALGGIIIGYLLLNLLDHFSLLIIIISVSVVFSLAFSRKKIILIFNLTALIVSIIILIINSSGKINKTLFNLLFPGYELLEIKDTPIFNFQVIKRKEQVSFLEDGILSFSVPDLMSSENIVHLNLLQHPNPQNILLVGTNGGQLIKEILKYHPLCIDCIELDAGIIKLVKKYVPLNLSRLYTAAQVHLYIGDIYSFIEKTSRKYDCIILNISAPINLQSNRFYTLEFFNRIKTILKKGGIISFKLPSQENYINKELGIFLSTIQNTLKKSFIDVKLYPGQEVFFFASNKKGVLTDDFQKLTETLRKKQIKTKFVNDYYLFERLSIWRKKFLRERLKELNKGIVNTNLHPVCLWMQTVYWIQQFRGKFRTFFENIKNWHILIAIVLFLSILTIWGVKVNKNKTILLSLSTTGFSELVYQLLIILSFQIFYGYVYIMLGLIFASFMLGLTLGAFYSLKKRKFPAFSYYIFIQKLVCIYPLIFIGIIIALKYFSIPPINFIGKYIIFFLLPFIAGFIGGMQFIVANQIISLFYKEESGPLTYSLDLLGSSIGALFVSLFLIPLWGIIETAFFIFILNFIVYLILCSKKDTTSSQEAVKL